MADSKAGSQEIQDKPGTSCARGKKLAITNHVVSEGHRSQSESVPAMLLSYWLASWIKTQEVQLQESRSEPQF